MANAVFKFLKDIEYDGTDFIRGDQIVLEQATGQTLVELGQVDLTRYLNPDSDEDNQLKGDIDAQVELKKLSGEDAEEQIAADSEKLEEVEEAQDVAPLDPNNP